ncbi:hypothetical protein [Singulisphaera sp. PoT]
MLSNLKDPWIFYGVSAALVAYLLYTMIRKRKGERPGTLEPESEL